MVVRAASVWIRSRRSPSTTSCRASPVLSFGTAGCNLACKFCQNWDMSKSREMDTLADAASPSPSSRATARRSLGCASVAFTYNDPTVFMEYAIDVAQACRERGMSEDRRGHGGLHVPASRGVEFYRCDRRRQRGPEGLHRALLPAPHLRLGTRARARHARVPQARDAGLVRDHHVADPRRERFRRGTRFDDALDRGRTWVPDVPLHFSAFHPDWKMIDHPPTPPADIDPCTGASRCEMACATCTRATCTMQGRAAAPGARAAACVVDRARLVRTRPLGTYAGRHAARQCGLGDSRACSPARPGSMGRTAPACAGCTVIERALPAAPARHPRPAPGFYLRRRPAGTFARNSSSQTVAGESLGAAPVAARRERTAGARPSARSASPSA